ncbi:MAG: SNF2-related protein [Verrucomicrobiota bacterium]
MQLKPFQKQDLARLALHDGAILAWDTGLGKTWAFLLWSMLKAGHEFKGGTLLPKAPCLIVAPGDLHAQMADEAWTHFRIRFIKLDSQAAFLQLSTLSPVDGQRSLPAGFYITSYTQLSTNGVPEVPDVAKMPAESWLAFFSLNQDHVAEYYARRGHHLRRYYELLESSPEDSLPTLQMRLRRLTCNASEFAQHAIHAAYEQLAPFHIDANNPLYSELPPNNRDIITSRFATHTYFEYTRHIGDTSSLPNQRRVKCIYAPTLADLCFNSFTCVAVDEGTRMKGENTLVGLGVRQLTPKYRLVSTATPIKNRLPDIFRLAWWVTGGREEAHARFPYANSSADRGDFAEEFLVSEHNLSAKKRRNPRYKKLTPNVCNVHRLWKMMAPIILRRRKHDIGEQIVSKHRHVIRAAMGTHQAETYKYHLRASYLDKNGRPAPGAKLQALRMAAAAPHAENLVPVLNGKGSHRSHTGYIPKIASALNLINQILRRGEQVVVGSAFIEPLNTLSCLLKEANVRHLRMDGSVSQTRRGMLSAQFKQGGPKYNPHASAKNLYPVTLAGVESCAEGHNWSRGKNVILIGFSAYP